MKLHFYSRETSESWEACHGLKTGLSWTHDRLVMNSWGAYFFFKKIVYLTIKDFNWFLMVFIFYRTTIIWNWIKYDIPWGKIFIHLIVCFYRIGWFDLCRSYGAWNISLFCIFYWYTAPTELQSVPCWFFHHHRIFPVIFSQTSLLNKHFELHKFPYHSPRSPRAGRAKSRGGGAVNAKQLSGSCKTACRFLVLI